MYSTKIQGEATTFGTSGLLYRSNKVMYDRATNTLWSSLLGEPVIGPLADSGLKLEVFPVVLTTWGEWLAEHPDTTVLSLETGVYPAASYRPESESTSIYYDYRQNPETIFPVWNRDGRLETKDEVLGVSIGGHHKAYPVEVLQRERVVNGQVGDTRVVIVASSISSEARVYASEGQGFALPQEEAGHEAVPASLVDSNGTRWHATEAGLVNSADSSQTLARIPSHVSFWFAWFAFHPDTELYDPGQSSN